LRVLAVSRSFYLTFQVHQQDVLSRPLYALGDGQWNIPALRMSLENIIRERAAMDPFEVEHEFPEIGRRIMLLNARCVFYADHSHTSLLLAFDDVTERRAIERQKEELLLQTEELLRQKDVLLRESPCRQQPSDHRKHLDAEGAHRDLGGDPPASSGRASTSHGGRCRAGAPPHICELRPDRDRSLPIEAMRKPRGLDDR
jgi:hypothetical protein